MQKVKINNRIRQDILKQLCGQQMIELNVYISLQMYSISH